MMKEKYGGLNLICKLVIIKEIIACMYKNCKKKKKFRLLIVLKLIMSKENGFTTKTDYVI